jgi:predicted outer membrane lipoprotein
VEPNPLAILGLCLAGAAGLIFLLWLNHRLRGRPKSEREEETQPPPTQAPMMSHLVALIMSYVFGSAGPIEPVGTEQRSDAVERSTEPRVTQPAEPVPDLMEQLATLTDDELLDILARLPGEDDDYRFAESRIAKFIPGRVEDRLAQVRAARGTEKPPAPGRQLRIRDQAGERLISMK